MNESNNYYNYSRPEVARFVPDSVKTLLDIGCSQGAFLNLIKQQIGAETWGIEASTDVAEIAKTNADYVFTGKVEDILASIPDNYFDCITFNDVLEHLLEPLEVLSMVRSKLSESGIVIASIPNVRFFDNLYELIIRKDWEYKDAGILDSTHFRFFTKKSMERIFDDAGYSLINQQGINEKSTFKFRLFAFLTLGFFSDTKYSQFVCIAKRK